MQRFRGLFIFMSMTAGLLAASSGFALTNEETDYLSLYFSPDELTVQSATRSPEPISRVAENVTVVTAADIERMNAHTLADVLNTVPGVEIFQIGGPGQIATPTILGSNDRHVTVILDGVVLNSLWSGVTDAGMIPVQNIEKIEIIKGPASSAWGSALGGIVNIITKSGRTVDQGGIVYGSVGADGFGDYRVEERGKQNGIGYYLGGGRLQFSGLSPHQSTSENNAYAKLSYDLTDKTDLLFTLAYARTWRDDWFSTDPAFPMSGTDRSEYAISTIGLNSAFSKNIDLNISFWSFHQYFNSGTIDLTTGDAFYYKDTNEGQGANAKLTWKGEQQTVVVGADSSNMADKTIFLPDGKQSLDKWAIYVNDTVFFNKLAVTPGLRFDHTDSTTNGDFWSPSLGITYGLGNDTLLRASAARGFNMPLTGDIFASSLGWIGNPDINMETVESYQGGIETAALNYVWLKLTVFRNDIRNDIMAVVLPSGEIQNQNIGRERRDGVVIEAKTKPVFNTSFSAGAEFVSAEDRNTHESIAGIPTQVYDIGVKYDDQQSLKAQLTGRHINWNAAVDDLSKYHSLLLDLNVSRKLWQHKDSSLEVFATGHNLLNTQQYLTAVYPNPSRWAEAGLRCSF